MKRASLIPILGSFIVSVKLVAGGANSESWSAVPLPSAGAAIPSQAADYHLRTIKSFGAADQLTSGSNEHFSIRSQQRGAQLGCSLAAGDLNGDTIDDLAIGGRGQSWSNGKSPQSGRIVLYPGSPSGLNATNGAFRDGPFRRASFGSAVSIIPDVNNDRCAELLVTGSTARQALPAGGHAWMFRGKPGSDILEAEHFWDAFGKRANALFGGGVSAAGDVNGDDHIDILIGAPGFRRTLNGEGMAILYLGKEAGFSREGSWTATGNRSEAAFGTSIAGLGDINHDGHDDVLISAPTFPGLKFMAGRVYAYLGGKEGLGEEPFWILEGGETGSQLGQSMAVFVGADGQRKFALGAPGRSDETCHGAVYIYGIDGSGHPNGPEQILREEEPGSLFGSAVSVGDLNGDGFADLVVSAPAFAGASAREGRVYVFHGAADGFRLTPSWILQGSAPETQAGWALCANGDFNGDGFDDLAIGSPLFGAEEPAVGRVDILYSSPMGLPVRALANEESGTIAHAAPGQREDLPALWPAIALLGCVAYVARRTWRKQSALEARAGVIREREQLARNLHDDVGAEVTRVLMLSRLAAEPASQIAPEKVAEAAAQLNRTVEKIIWVLHPENDELEKFVDYACSDLARLCESSGVELRTDVPLELPRILLPRHVREHLHLSLKECIANALKHSNASEIQICVEIRAHEMCWRIADNGIGAAGAPAAGQNGIANVERRMADLGGAALRSCAPGGGTAITLTVPIP